MKSRLGYEFSQILLMERIQNLISTTTRHIMSIFSSSMVHLYPNYVVFLLTLSSLCILRWLQPRVIFLSFILTGDGKYSIWPSIRSVTTRSIRDTWNNGCMFIVLGRSNLYLYSLIIFLIENSPIFFQLGFCNSFKVFKFQVKSQILSLTPYICNGSLFWMSRLLISWLR